MKKIIEYFKNKRKEKNLPLIAKVDLAQLQKERLEKAELGDVSILARTDYTKRIPTIRLCYVAFEKFKRYGRDDVKVGKTYGYSNPYRLPLRMSLEDGIKVVSYLTEKVEKENGLSTNSEKCVAEVSKRLSDYGFRKVEGYESGHFHEVADYERVTSTLPVCKKIDGVVDVFTVGGEKSLFMWSELGKRYFKWNKKGIKREQVKDIYDNINMNLDELENMSEIIKTGSKNNWKDNDGVGCDIKTRIFNESSKKR